MGIIRAAWNAVSGSLADQWQEVIEPDDMSDTTVFVSGISVRQNDRRNVNRKGSENIVVNGSVIHVYPNQFMMLVDGGKIVDYTAEEGYYKVDNSSSPSLFHGELDQVIEKSFERIKFGGIASGVQKVFYVNLQEIKGIKFGTRNPINYFDSFYNAELFLRCHGTYSIKIKDPIRFYEEVVPRNRNRVEIQDINEQYMSEFMEALQSSINQMSADGVRISFVSSKGRELGRYMSQTLDADWNKMRGMEIQSVGIASISYDETSAKLINMRNQGAMLSDPSVREGYMQGAVARGMEAAGSNASGSTAGFMGMNMGMQTGGSFIGAASLANMQQMQMNRNMGGSRSQDAESQGDKRQTDGRWICSCGAENTGKFCSECGKARPEEKKTWTCVCGSVNTGKFCSECGKPRVRKIRCDKCGYEPDMSRPLPKFCPECGDPINEADMF